MDKNAKKICTCPIKQIKDGVNLDEFAKDKRATVRAAVVKYQPKYRKAVFEAGVTPLVWHAFYGLFLLT